MNDAEEESRTVEPVAAEHGAAGQASQLCELVKHEVFEAVVPVPHGGLQWLACCHHANGDGKSEAMTPSKRGKAFEDQLLDLLQLMGR